MRLISALIALALATAPAMAIAQPPPVEPQEQATTVDGLTVTGTNERIPLTSTEYEVLHAVDRGAPQYSVEQMASFVCQDFPGARGAMAATERFEAVKAAYREGKATADQLATAERERQNGVNGMARGEFRNVNFMPDAARSRTRFGDLSVTTDSFRVLRIQGETVMAVNVRITNSGPRPILTPGVMIHALDRSGRILASQAFGADPPRRVAPGETITTELAFLNMPFYTADTLASFEERRVGRRNQRNCPSALEYHTAAGLSLNLSTAELLRMGDRVDPTWHPEAELVLPVGRVKLLVTSTHWREEGDHDALDVIVEAHNESTATAPIPPMNLVIYDAQDRAVGGSRVVMGATTVDPGQSFEMVVSLTNPAALPAAGGANPLSLLKRIAVVVEEPPGR